MNIQEILLIFALISGMLLITGSIVTIHPTNNPVNIIPPIMNQTTIYQNAKNHTLIDQNAKNKTDPIKNQTPVLSPDDPAVKMEFDRIATTPYDEKNYNCLNKSLDFHNYLLRHGATNAYLVRVKHRSGDYMHIFVVWNGLAYDPANQIPCYGVDYNKYIDALNEQGFTTVVD